MSVAQVAAQLRAAQGAGPEAPAALGAAASTALGALLSGGRERLSRLGAAPGASAGAAAPLPLADGTRCEGCGAAFGLLSRRNACGSCDRLLCARCLGSPLAVAGLSCLCSSACPRCREQNAQFGEFEACRAAMEKGASVTMAMPRKAGFFGAAEPRKVGVWLSLDSDNELRWQTLEQRCGKPAEEGRIPMFELLAARDTGVLIELAIKGQSQPMMLDFGPSAEERQAWARYLDLALEVLTPESERASLKAAREQHRGIEIEERRALNEERKKKLTQGLGMRFTAEAMMNRSSTS